MHVKAHTDVKWASFNGAWNPTRDISSRAECLGMQIELVTRHRRSRKSSTSKIQIQAEFYLKDISPPTQRQLPIWDNGREYFELLVMAGHVNRCWLDSLWLHKYFIVVCSIKLTPETQDLGTKASRNALKDENPHTLQTPFLLNDLSFWIFHVSIKTKESHFWVLPDYIMKYRILLAMRCLQTLVINLKKFRHTASPAVKKKKKSGGHVREWHR